MADIIDHDEMNEEFRFLRDGVKIGILGFFRDDHDRMWLNDLDVKEGFRRQGIATKMILRAIEEYKAVYASRGNKNDHSDLDPSDTRHLSGDAQGLVWELIKRGIMKHEWYFNPNYEEKPGSEEDDYGPEN